MLLLPIESSYPDGLSIKSVFNVVVWVLPALGPRPGVSSFRFKVLSKVPGGPSVKCRNRSSRDLERLAHFIDQAFRRKRLLQEWGAIPDAFFQYYIIQVAGHE